MEAYCVLEEILAQTTLAHTLPDCERESKTLDLAIGFSLGNAQFLLRLKDVGEILKEVALTPIPGADEAIAGIFNLKGNFITVVHLGRMFKITEKKAIESFSAVFTFNYKDLVCAACVSHILEIIHFSSKHVIPISSEKDKSFSEFCSEGIVHENVFLPIFSVDKLMTHPSLEKLLSSM